MEKRKIILDCDPGHDDAIAIMVAGLHKKFDLLGITIVAGNQTYEKVTKNALKICDYLKIDVPVYGGCDKPLKRDQIIAPLFHGETGLDGIKLPETNKKLEEQNAVDFIIETLIKSEEKITLVPVGPLTNIATVLTKEPRVKEKIKEIVLMGGSCKGGNRTPFAEFNIFADPEAADIVFNSGLEIKMMGLEITDLTMPNKEIVDKIKEFGTKASEVLYNGLHFPVNYDENGNFEYHTLHDVVTLAYMIDESLVKLEKIACKIELNDKEKYGQTICSNCECSDFTKDEIEKSKIYTGVEINLDKFWNIIFEVIK